MGPYRGRENDSVAIFMVHIVCEHTWNGIKTCPGRV